jgi:hypothetical protein
MRLRTIADYHDVRRTGLAFSFRILFVCIKELSGDRSCKLSSGIGPASFLRGSVKNYCSCFRNGVMCGPSRGCFYCLNNEANHDVSEATHKDKMENQQWKCHGNKIPTIGSITQAAHKAKRPSPDLKHLDRACMLPNTMLKSAAIHNCTFGSCN